MSRAVIFESFGEPEVLELKEVSEPHPGPGEVRVRVMAASLNPMDWKILSSADLAAAFKVTLPSGFGHDLAGLVDEVGENVTAFNVGERVAGGALCGAVSDYAIVKAENLHRIPDVLDYDTASSVPIAGMTAYAVMDTIKVKPGETVLIGGAGGGVGVFSVQLAVLAGAEVIGTCSKTTFDFVSGLGAEPVAYGPGLAERIRETYPRPIDAAADLVGTETVSAALELGVAPDRIVTIAAGTNPPGGVRATGGGNAPKEAVGHLIDLIASGKLKVPIAAKFPVEKIQEAVAMQKSGHVHGKIVVLL